MKAFTVVYWVFTLLTPGIFAEQSCQIKTEWGDSACSLGGSLMVKSVPGNKEVSSKSCDQFFVKHEFHAQPKVALPDAKSGEKYTLVMVDPDAPNHPKGTCYLHWIVSDISADGFKNGDLKNSKTISSYKGPTPPQGTGIHRYILLAFRQTPGTSVAQAIPDNQRAKFNLADWVKKNRLCGPESGAQFRTNFSGDPKNKS